MSDPSDPSTGQVARELHQDLARKYRMHRSKIEELWRSFDKAQRTRVLRAGAADGVVLKHRMDVSMGNVCKMMPEWNLKDITEAGSDFLLEILDHRSTTSLEQQFFTGVNGQPGDGQFTLEMMRTRNLRHTESFKDCWTFFLDGDEYGKSYRVLSHREEFLRDTEVVRTAGQCLPQSIGELILTRQTYLLQALVVIIDDILEQGSKTRIQKKRLPKNKDGATAALAKLSVQPRPNKLSISELLDSARDQKTTLEDYLGMLSTEPVVLAHSVNIWFFSRPELVADEKGRLLPVHTDRYISPVFLEAIQNAVKGAATWTYIVRLLETLQASTDKVHRAIVLQEISNVCHMEFSCAQSLFKRQVQSGTGAKYFKRVSNVYDNGNARVSMKVVPEDLTRSDPQLHYMLRLCQAETTALKAVDWLDKLAHLHTAHPEDREKLEEREFEALCDLAVVVAFIQDLSSAVSLPPLSRKKGQLFASRSKELELELSQLKTDVDLRDFVVPIDNLLEPGVADGAMRALDNFIVDRTGTKLGFLYQDLIDDCLMHIEKQQQQAKENHEQQSDAEFVPLPSEDTQASETRLQQRRQKEKTRPIHSSAYDIISPSTGSNTQEGDDTQSPTFTVKAWTAQVFSNLLSKSESRGTVSWTSFEAAMVDLGFSVMPKFGSVYTFLPPASMNVKKSLTVHRPHGSNLEPWKLTSFAKRLKRVYGWDEDTFKVA